MSDPQLIKIAQDVGYIRGVIEPIAEANLPERVTALEASEDRRRRFRRNLVVGVTSTATLASAFSGWVLLIH